MQREGANCNDGDGRSNSSGGSCAFLASRNTNPPWISPLIKQHVSQCSKDYYEWHFTSQMSAIRQYRMCWAHAKSL